MNEYQTAQFAVGASLVGACFVLGLIITELLRKLAKERETVERLRRLNSRNYMHRVQMERAIDAHCHAMEFDVKTVVPSFQQVIRASQASKEDHD